jgi:hypothetical protein
VGTVDDYQGQVYFVVLVVVVVALVVDMKV